MTTSTTSPSVTSTLTPEVIYSKLAQLPEYRLAEVNNLLDFMLELSENNGEFRGEYTGLAEDTMSNYLTNLESYEDYLVKLAQAVPTL